MKICKIAYGSHVVDRIVIYDHFNIGKKRPNAGYLAEQSEKVDVLGISSVVVRASSNDFLNSHRGEVIPTRAIFRG